MAANTFLIGSTASADPNDWSEVATLLSSARSDITAARALGWEFAPYSNYIMLGDKSTRGVGLPVVTWTFKGLRIEQRENLRDFIPDVTQSVYIRTKTNETAAGVATYKDFLCLAKWVQRPEIVYSGLDAVMQVEIKFEHCVDVT